MSEISTDDTTTARALATVFSRSITELTAVADEQMLAIGATAAVVACLPETAQIPPERIAAVINLLARQRQDSEAHRQKLARFVGAIMSTARMLQEREAAGAEPSSPTTTTGPAAP
jgi:hypothetical protein